MGSLDTERDVLLYGEVPTNQGFGLIVGRKLWKQGLTYRC